MTDINRNIFDHNYTADNVMIRAPSTYDQGMIDLRFDYIRRYGAGKDVLDLCCGTGSYLLPCLDAMKTAIGLDFSINLLRTLAANIPSTLQSKARVVLGDAMQLPLADRCVDFVFSYTALYYVPDLQKALIEVARVLRPGGHAVLELGNSRSLNVIVSDVQHKDLGWAKDFSVPVRSIERHLDECGLRIEQWRSFQLWPTYGTPRRLFYLAPLLSPRWKSILGISIAGRMIDEWISSVWPLRLVAFRHVVVVCKK